MIPTKELADPFEIVANALSCSRTSLSMDSARYRDHGWDSFGHLKIIIALEEAYGIRIDNDEIERYATMKEIHQLYEQIRLGDDQRDD
jgi:acyl carrier protein